MREEKGKEEKEKREKDKGKRRELDKNKFKMLSLCFDVYNCII
jgi:hypothetical protein